MEPVGARHRGVQAGLRRLGVADARTSTRALERRERRGRPAVAAPRRDRLRAGGSDACLTRTAAGRRSTSSRSRRREAVTFANPLAAGGRSRSSWSRRRWSRGSPTVACRLPPRGARAVRAAFRHAALARRLPDAADGAAVRRRRARRGRADPRGHVAQHGAGRRRRRRAHRSARVARRARPAAGAVPQIPSRGAALRRAAGGIRHGGADRDRSPHQPRRRAAGGSRSISRPSRRRHRARLGRRRQRRGRRRRRSHGWSAGVRHRHRIPERWPAIARWSASPPPNRSWPTRSWTSACSAVAHGYGKAPIRAAAARERPPGRLCAASRPRRTACRSARRSTCRRLATPPTVYTVEIPAAADEVVGGEQRRSVLVPAPARPRRVLLVEGAPGFEHSFLKRAWSGDRGLEIDSVVRKGRDDSGADTFYVQAARSRGRGADSRLSRPRAKRSSPTTSSCSPTSTPIC